MKGKQPSPGIELESLIVFLSVITVANSPMIKAKARVGTQGKKSGGETTQLWSSWLGTMRFNWRNRANSNKLHKRKTLKKTKRASLATLRAVQMKAMQSGGVFVKKSIHLLFSFTTYKDASCTIRRESP